ncbi:hypothetical protein DYB38_007360, partial [Aphanomyces astaci]
MGCRGDYEKNKEAVLNLMYGHVTKVVLKVPAARKESHKAYVHVLVIYVDILAHGVMVCITHVDVDGTTSLRVEDASSSCRKPTRREVSMPFPSTFHVDPGDERYKEIPSQFVCMWPLDTTTSQHRNVAGSFGYPSHSYKVLSDTDGRTYALRRIENARTTPAIVQQAVDMWKRVQHAAMVPLHRGF